jgi:hypothetical protein
MTREAAFQRIHLWLALFLAGLLFSGITAFPLVHESAWLVHISAALGLPQHAPAMHAWFVRVANALTDTATKYPFLPYGTDWLAFGHLVIALAFVGVWRDPVRNRWLIDWGAIACLAVPFLAFIAGHVRGIPIFWSIIDSSFGIFGCIPLLIVRRYIQRLETGGTQNVSAV